MRGRRGTGRPDWMKSLRVGDVLTDGRIFRVVRALGYREGGALNTVTFAIRRPSWTGRCYTTMSWSDLKLFGYRPTGIRVRDKSDLALRVQRAIDGRELRRPWSCTAQEMAGAVA